jgi:hypothetical protein
MASPLLNAVEFLRDFGLFDVIIPFILVFSIVFAILEKTRIFGVDMTTKNAADVGGYPQKNLNGAVAFVVAMIVVASANVVSVINTALPNIILVMVIAISFLILIGLFWKSGEMDFQEKHKTYYKGIVFVFLIVVLGIFLAAIPHEGTNVLMFVIDYIMDNLSGAAVGSVVMLAVVVGVIFLVTKSPGKPEDGKAEGEE